MLPPTRAKTVNGSVRDMVEATHLISIKNVFLDYVTLVLRNSQISLKMLFELSS